MKKSFMCSLCRGGIIGGALYLDNYSVTYKTQKLTIPDKYKNLVLPLEDIKEIKWEWIIFPVATIYLLNGDSYNFIIFNKNRFIKYYQEIKGK